MGAGFMNKVVNSLYNPSMTSQSTGSKKGVGFNPSNSGFTPVFQDGNKISTLGMLDRFMNRFPTREVIDNKGAATLTEFAKPNGTVIRSISRELPGYTNTTQQVIKNYGTPQADTLFISPRGNKAHVKDAPN